MAASTTNGSDGFLKMKPMPILGQTAPVKEMSMVSSFGGIVPGNMLTLSSGANLLA